MEATIKSFATYTVDHSIQHENKDFAPITTATIKLVQGSQCNKKPLLCLLDSSSTSLWINKTSVPAGIHGKRVSCVTSNTIARDFTSNKKVILSGFFFKKMEIYFLLKMSA